MNFFVSNENKKQLEDICNILQNAENGQYYINIIRIDDEKDSETYRAQFFAKLTELANYTGYSKQDIYSMFKDDNDIQSLKGQQTKELWVEIIDKLGWWAFKNLEIAI